MTKRAPGQFGRKESDHYPTPMAAVVPLIPHLQAAGVRTFAEPCCADGELIGHLEAWGFDCVAKGDIRGHHKRDARGWSSEDYGGVDVVITNPPWEALTMAAIMEHQSTFRPAWFLIYSDWLFTQQSARLVRDRCTDIVPVGRVKWFPDSESVGYDNCCWVRMDAKKDGDTQFWSRPPKTA